MVHLVIEKNSFDKLIDDATKKSKRKKITNLQVLMI